MGLFTRKPAEQFVPYADAAVYAAQGYAVLPVERYYVERGPSWAQPEAYEAPNGGGWGWGLPTPPDSHNWVTSIQCGILPRLGAKGLDECKATWVPVVRVAGAGKRVAKDIAAMVGDAIVRLDVENGDVLVAYRAARNVADPREYDVRRHRVTCYANGAFLVASPRHVWLDDRSPATVARADLPTLDWSGARDIVATLDSLLSKAAA
jgi:hypothetical protein